MLNICFLRLSLLILALYQRFFCANSLLDGVVFVGIWRYFLVSTVLEL